MTNAVHPDHERDIDLEASRYEEVAALAFQLWTERGCPIGSPEDDWFQAEMTLNNKPRVVAAAV